jgi:predicted RNase H-like HicB family nuclease
MSRADTGESDSPRREIRLIEETDGWWSAVDETTGVASQGETQSEALANLEEALALHRGDVGEPVTDDDLRDLGIDPETVSGDATEPDAPWFSK